MESDKIFIIFITVVVIIFVGLLSLAIMKKNLNAINECEELCKNKSLEFHNCEAKTLPIYACNRTKTTDGKSL